METDPWKEKIRSAVLQIDKIKAFFEEFGGIINNTNLQSIAGDAEKTKKYWHATMTSLVQLRSTIIELGNTVADLNIDLDWMANDLSAVLDTLYKKLPSEQRLDRSFVEMLVQIKTLKFSMSDEMRKILMHQRDPGHNI